MFRAALFNPFAEATVDAKMDKTVKQRCIEAIKEEALLFCEIQHAEEFQDSIAEEMNIEWDAFALQKKRNKLDPEGLEFEEQAGKLRDFFKMTAFAAAPHIGKVCKAYFSAQVSSAKSETTFSFTGNMVSKTRGSLSVESIEAATVAHEMMKQPGYRFKNMFDAVCELAGEWEALKRKKKEERKKERESLIGQLEQMINDSSDGEENL